MKQAIDNAYDEWHAKPVGFVSYGCGSVGLHAMYRLRTVFTALHVVTMRGGRAAPPVRPLKIREEGKGS